MTRLRRAALLGLLASACVPASAAATIIPPSATDALAGGPQTIALPTGLPPYLYTPASIAISPGPLSWSGSLAAHPLVFDDGAPGTSSGTLFQRTLTPGVVRFHCLIHGGTNGFGMAGVAYVAGPDAKLTATPATRTTAGPVTLDASGTDFVDLTANTTATYAFDTDGDGTFETTGGAPTTQAVFPLGTRTAKVRVTDDDGRTDEATVTVKVGETTSPASGGGTSGGGTTGGAGDTPAGGSGDASAPILGASGAAGVSRRALLKGPVRVTLGTLSERASVAGTLRLRGTTIGRVAVKTSSAGTLRVTVRLTAAGRRALRSARATTLSLRLELTDTGGNRRVVSRAVRLRR